MQFIFSYSIELYIQFSSKGDFKDGLVNDVFRFIELDCIKFLREHLSFIQRFPKVCFFA